MKIRKIEFENHKIFGDLKLDFTDEQGNTIDTIIIAGENGVGKSQLLNAIYEFSNINLDSLKRDEKRTFEIQLSDSEVEILKNSQNSKAYFVDKNYTNNIFKIKIDYNTKDSWTQIDIRGKL